MKSLEFLKTSLAITLAIILAGSLITIVRRTRNIVRELESK